MHSKFMFYLFADDTSILYGNKNLKSLEWEVNVELNKLCEWLTANKLTLMLRNLIMWHFEIIEISYFFNQR